MILTRVRTMIDPEYRKRLGQRIKELRKQHKQTQKELALALSISVNQLNKYECGLTCPSAELFIKLAELLGVTLDYLLTGRELDLPLKDPRMIERLQQVESLEAGDREAVLKLIDAMILKRKVQGALNDDERLRTA